MVKLKKKSLSRGCFGTHGRVIGNKNFFFLPNQCLHQDVCLLEKKAENENQ